MKIKRELKKKKSWDVIYEFFYTLSEESAHNKTIFPNEFSSNNNVHGNLISLSIKIKF